MKLRQSESPDKVYQVEIEWHDLGVTRAAIEVRIGYDGGGAPEPFGRMIDEVLAEAGDLLAIRAGFRLVSVSRPEGRRDGLVIDGTLFTTGKIVAGELAGADEAAVFVCTIGPGLENRAAELVKEGEPAPAFIVDSAASEFAERTAAVLHDHVAAVMGERSRGVTNRYSPGYCNWDVAEQRLLFSLLPDGFCGIHLTESALMLPVKSVSGIIGTGTGVERRDYRCDRCGVEECTWRAIRARKS